jgi:hypothetical protein
MQQSEIYNYKSFDSFCNSFNVVVVDVSYV